MKWSLYDDAHLESYPQGKLLRRLLGTVWAMDEQLLQTARSRVPANITHTYTTRIMMTDYGDGVRGGEGGEGGGDRNGR